MSDCVGFCALTGGLLPLPQPCILIHVMISYLDTETEAARGNERNNWGQSKLKLTLL